MGVDGETWDCQLSCTDLGGILESFTIAGTETHFKGFETMDDAALSRPLNPVSSADGASSVRFGESRYSLASDQGRQDSLEIKTFRLGRRRALSSGRNGQVVAVLGSVEPLSRPGLGLHGNRGGRLCGPSSLLRIQSCRGQRQRRQRVTVSLCSMQLHVRGVSLRLLLNSARQTSLFGINAVGGLR